MFLCVWGGGGDLKVTYFDTCEFLFVGETCPRYPTVKWGSPPRSCNLCFFEDLSAVQSGALDILLSGSTHNQAGCLGPSFLCGSAGRRHQIVCPRARSLLQPPCGPGHASLPVRYAQRGYWEPPVEHRARPPHLPVPPAGSPGRNATRRSLTSWTGRGLEKEKASGKDPERGGRPQREARPRPRRCAPRERAGPARAQPGA